MNKTAVKKLILLVDADDVCRRIVGQRLGIAGYEVVQVSDGAAAIESIKLKKPDLIISEFSVPKVSGKKICAFVKQDPRLADIPIIILSHKHMLHDTIMALDAGARDYITKPFSLSELEARIRAALRG